MSLKAAPFETSLWQECDLIYAQHQPVLIDLQEEFGISINLLLLALWLDQHNYSLTKLNWQQLSIDIDKHDQRLLLPFRSLRKQSKPHLSHAEYQKMLEVELMLERKTQQFILDKLNQFTMTPHQTEVANATHYLALFGEKAVQLKLR